MVRKQRRGWREARGDEEKVEDGGLQARTGGGDFLLHLFLTLFSKSTAPSKSTEYTAEQSCVNLRLPTHRLSSRWPSGSRDRPPPASTMPTARQESRSPRKAACHRDAPCFRQPLPQAYVGHCGTRATGCVGDLGEKRRNTLLYSATSMTSFFPQTL